MAPLRSHRRVKGERGVVMVEFAFVLPLLLTLVFGIMDFGRALNYWIYQTHLSSEGARYALVNTWPGCPLNTAGICGSVSGTTSLQRFIHDSVDTAELLNGVKVCIDVGVNSVPAPIAGDPVKVTVSYPFKWLGFFKGFGTTTIGNAATMRLEVKPTHFNSGCYP
jgi:hypothetical protein